ncbi:ShlB/FhaC/HecB family hemolysin secretion/activation protein [Neisseria sp. S1]|uniref:ShlB/FhaC/HecB family hemolysin secretion/activation protein n=1 Tax=Neisseria sp. S1 TaxID=3318354 RepID=UPI003A843EDD
MKTLNSKIKPLATALVTLTLPTTLFSAPIAAESEHQAAEVQQNHFLREQLRIDQQQQQWQPSQDVRLDRKIQSPATTLPEEESPCFHIQQVLLDGDSAQQFQADLKKSLDSLGFKSGMCLGAQGINRIMSSTQNTLIGKGYITTRILAAPQDLNNSILTLTVVPGRIGKLYVQGNENSNNTAGRIANFQNEFPISNGQILNLRDLEQGLENLKRIPTAEADIRIEPAAAPDQSDVVVQWQQRPLPYRLSFSVDDSGSKETGKYQANVTFSADNPFGLSDLFYLSYGRDLGHKASYTDNDGHTTGSGSKSLAAHYSVPFGNWLWAFNHSRYRYHQAVAGDSENYDYNGERFNTDIGVTRLLYRDAHRKSHAGLKLWKQESHSFINDAEIPVQRRKTAGWGLNLSHKEYIGNATLNLGAAYKRGTGGANSLRAPEEAVGEGTSRMKILTADADLNLPFSIGKQTLAYDTAVHAQWNKSPLIQLDKLAIGGRYTVRGFDGEMTLAAERGWYWRNDLSWQYRPGHLAYIGADVGHVSGPSAPKLLGQTLAGGVVGLKGQIKASGQLYYDVFASKPFKKPAGFQTANTALGFSLNYSF